MARRNRPAAPAAGRMAAAWQTGLPCAATTMSVAVSLAFALADHAAAQTAPVVLPTGERLVAGQASVSRPQGQAGLLVQQNSRSAIVEWGSFSIGAGGSVRFNQPDAASVILNRVVGGRADAGCCAGPSPSRIDGSMTANGNVFLVNPSGVLFTPGSSVSVGGLVASTLDIDNRDFMAGTYRFRGTGTFATVSNQGSLHAAERGTVALLGGQVSNDGTIEARLGTVALAAGNAVTLDFAGDGLTRIRVDEASVRAQVANHGMIVADGGRAVLTAQAADALTQTVVNQAGTVRAQSLVERDGQIVLDGGAGGVVRVGGPLDASGPAAGARGGAIQVRGDRIGITGRATLDARGDTGGGTVQLGGDSLGADPQARIATTTYFGPDAAIDASATTAGNGGTVAVRSDAATRALGTIRADGGARRGDGGTVEISGRHLEVDSARVSAGAPNGQAGTWQIGSSDIDIVQAVPGAGQASIVDDDPVSFTASGTTTIPTAPINAALSGGTSVSVRAAADLATRQAGRIAVRGAHDATAPDAEAADTVRVPAATIDKTGGAPVTLALRAHDSVVMEPGTAVRSDADAGRLDVALGGDADGSLGGGVALQQDARILSNGGSVALTGRGVTLDQATLDTRRGTDGPGGAIVISSTGPAEAGAITLDRSTLNASTGSVSLTGTGVAGGVSVVDSDLSTTAGAVTLSGSSGGRAPGVSLAGSNVSASGGTITLSGAGRESRAGVSIERSSVTTAQGAITVSGTGSDAGVAIRGTDSRSVARVATTQGGDIAISGTIGPRPLGSPPTDGGVVVGPFGSVATAGSGSGRILVSGQSDANGAAGVRVDAQGRIGGAATQGDIVISAGAPAATDSIDLAAGEPAGSPPIGSTPTVSTAGVIDLRPGAAAGSIGLGGATTSAAAALDLSDRDLRALDSRARTIVFGASNQSGPITVRTPQSFDTSVTLQNNGAAASGGIDIAAPLSSTGTVALVSAGRIAQTAPIAAPRLLVSSRQGDITLHDGSNRVGTAALAAPAGAVDFASARRGDAPLALGPVDATAFRGDSNAPQVVALSQSTSQRGFIARALDGDLALGQDVLATGAGADIELATAGVLTNAGRTLAPGAGGRWLIRAGTWEGERRGGLTPSAPRPNLYGCLPGQTSCASGAVVPDGGNHFVYAQQPSITITIGNAQRTYGAPNPAPPALQVAGVQSRLGDTESDARAGAPVMDAAANTPVGIYPIAGSFSSPAGYRITVIPGQLTIDRALLTYVADPASRPEGEPNPPLTGSVTGFVAGDTLESATTGTLVFATPANTSSPAGRYPIEGSGLDARNYSLQDHPRNATALAVTRRDPGGPGNGTGTGTGAGTETGAGADPGAGTGAGTETVLPRLPDALLGIVPVATRDVTSETSSLYEKNLGATSMCMATGPLTAMPGSIGGDDTLDVEWSRVRSKPQVSNCLAVPQSNGCSDF